jgi:2-dehydropantoate 2-reductase
MAPYGIVGDGKLARHLCFYLGSLGLPYRQWSRRTHAEPANRVLAECPVIGVAISDAAIEPWIRDFTAREQGASKTFIHFSGSLSTDLATGFHPLMTFGPELYPSEQYRSIPFVCDKNGRAFAEIFPTLPNPHFPLSREKKALYHALCVLSGNFTALLWQKIFVDLEAKLGIPAETARPYFERVNANLGANLATDPRRALTGPLQRGDTETLQRDLAALEGDPYHRIFQAFMEAFQK